MSEAAITLTDLGFFHARNRWILRHLDLRLPRGAVLAVLGPNGRGKTTLLRLLLGDLNPREGEARLTEAAAFVPQLFQTSFDYGVLDMVLMGRARRIGLFSSPSRADLAAAREALALLGLDGLAGRPFSALSGGQRQLVIFARALAAEARILILDEPTSALDLRNQGLILEWIARLSREHGLTVVMTTHQPAHALACADTALLMLGPGEHRLGPPAQVLTEAAMLALYGAPMKRLSFEHQGEGLETLVPIFAPPRPAPAR